ncbi:nicotinate-nucleotide--dimethylbenzimidazole phosphoribosyltransferase, partial [Pseudomonas quasicaspiana]|nr:nicotinate-nucleotide--dimethylbenzimidazole phosphoribosyltransferase [Pseudomonas quasicaspiana]
MSNSWWLEPAQAINVPVREEALARQQQLTKPTGSLGQL